MQIHKQHDCQNTMHKIMQVHQISVNVYNNYGKGNNMVTATLNIGWFLEPLSYFRNSQSLGLSRAAGREKG